MEFRILGPVEVRVDERTAAIGGTKQRTLLGVLLLHANEVVSSERLVAELWGVRPPPSASKLIQTYVGALRKALGPLAVVTQPPGYVISASEGELDALRFTRLLADARSERDPARGAMLLREALALWRGNALADVGFEGPAAIEAERLDELRLDAVALRVERDLALGRHAQLVGELQSLVEAYPLRERLRALLMLALYRSGRQADALGVYAATRQLLDLELGLEPSEQLQRLERQVLVHDPGLELEVQAERAPVTAVPAPQPTASAGHDLRKTVTVVFADVTNFTSFSEALDPETLRATMSVYFDAMRAAIQRRGGTVEKFAGDEGMAVFGVPVAREDDALRAVRAAVDMQGALAALNDDFALAGFEIEARTGINTGTVVAGDVSAGHGFVTGDPVNVGKRLEQAAGAGEILLGATTFTLVRHAVEAEAVGSLALKGKAAAVPAYRLTRLIEGAPGFARRLEAPLVGRAGESRAFRSGAATQPHMTLLAEVMYRQGRYREAERFVALDEPWETSVELDVCIAHGSVRAKLLARRGRTAEAVALASETAARAAQTDALQLHGDVLIDLAEVLRLAGDDAGAVEAVAQALELYERKGATVSADRAHELLAAVPGASRGQPVR